MLDVCRGALSTGDPLQMLLPLALPDTATPTSSPASAAGPLPCGLPAGPLTDLFGQALAPANPSPPQAGKAEALTSGICGLHGFGSSASVALTQSLANRLRERLGSAGSIEYLETWRRKVTPAGRRYWAHTASARRTSGSACSGWPMPKSDSERAVVFESAINEWKRGHLDALGPVAQLAGWPTPDGLSHAQTYMREPGRERNRNLAALAGWATPTQRDHKDGASDLTNVPINALLGRQATLSGSPASTEKRGALNPLFSLWLMGFPTEWASCGERVTPLSRRSRRSL